ncbi:MAG: TonB-dependent receptor [Betaproteobacteria bacterium]|nr:TonB-dependent receptor [Betaproteobacteria bacterium]
MFNQRKLAGALIATCLGTLGAVTLAAAQQPQKVEKFEVTGSNIKRVDSETPSPIQVITREDIARSGSNSIAELLRDIPSAAGGSVGDFNAGNGFGRGTQSVSLRGLGSVGTLVLVNGRRVETAPVADPNLGQGAGFNLNVIPVGAIERIEVLKDGASAIYGSDAIAGVINVILRKDYQVGEISFTGRENHNGDFRNQQYAGTVGFGSLAKDKYNVLASMEYFRRDKTSVYDAKDIRNDIYTPFNGRLIPNSTLSYPANQRREAVNGNGAFTVVLPLDPRCPAALTFGTLCRSNTFDDANEEAKTERKSIFTRGTMDFSANLSGFAEFRFTRAESQFIAAPPSLDAAAPSTWFNAAGQRFSYTLFLPVGHPDNPNNFRLGLRYRFVDLGRTFQNVTNDSTNALAGLSGTWRTWDWESAFQFGQTKRTDNNNGQLYLPALQAAVANGTYRFFGKNDPAVLAALEPYKEQHGTSKTTSWDLKGSSELMTLAGGPLAVASGLQLRKEEFDIVSDPRNVAGEFVGVASSTVHGSRNVASLYAEFSVPFVKTLEMQVAGRYDHYSDYGNSTTPKVGLKWTPITQLAFRTTYSEAFRAPSLLQISNGNVQSFNAGINDPLRCGKPGANVSDCSAANGGTGLTISSLISPNVHLQPEKSKSYTFGFIFSPTASTSASVDYFNIHRRDFIDRFDSQTVINNEFNPAFTGGIVLRDPNPATWLPGVANSGPIQSTIRRFDNFGEAIVAGLDVDVSHSQSLGEWGKVKLQGTATYLTKTDWSLTRGGALTSGLGNFFIFETPRTRGTFTAIWDYADFSFMTRYNFTGKWNYSDPINGCFASAATVAAMGGKCEVGKWETVDVSVGYTGFKNLSLSFLVRNVTSRDAPYDPNQQTLGFNPTFHNPYGANYVLTANYRFK